MGSELARQAVIITPVYQSTSAPRIGHAISFLRFAALFHVGALYGHRRVVRCALCVCVANQGNLGGGGGGGMRMGIYG
jgi:hypothetical protein